MPDEEILLSPIFLFHNKINIYIFLLMKFEKKTFLIYIYYKKKKITYISINFGNIGNSSKFGLLINSY